MFVYALITGMPFLSAVLAGVMVAMAVSLLMLVALWLWVSILSTYTELMWPGSTAEWRRAKR